jgi:hypothetical protein
MTITLRSTKGSALTWAELDGNFSDLSDRTNLSWAQVGGEPSVVEGSGNAPELVPFIGGINAWSYGPSSLSEAFATSDLPFDWCPGTDLVYGVHWSPGNSTATGTVRFGLEFTHAWTYGQGDLSVFPATTTVYIQPTITEGTPYEHYLHFNAPADNFPASMAQQNMRFLVRIFRDGGNAADTFPDPIFIIGTDLFYQTDRLGTPTKAPPFPTTPIG